MTDRTMRRAIGAAAMLATSAALGACAQNGARTMSETATQTTTISGGAVSLAAGESMAEMFADPKIAAIASAANADEIETSRLALQMAQDARVRSFAQMMVDGHGAVETKLQAMLRSKHLATVDNALSIGMKNNLQPTLAELRGMSGRAFDMAYMLHQVAAHDMVLKTIDTSLLPEVDDQAMRNFLTNEVRPAVAEHLRMAKEIHHALTM